MVSFERTSIQFFRSQVQRGSREKDLDFDERMMFFKPIHWKRKRRFTLRPGEVGFFFDFLKNIIDMASRSVGLQKSTKLSLVLLFKRE